MRLLQDRTPNNLVPKRRRNNEAVIVQLLMAMDVSTSRHVISLGKEGSESKVWVLPDSFERKPSGKQGTAQGSCYLVLSLTSACTL